MLHNAQVNYDVVLKNIEEALVSKFLILGQGSGRAELHAESTLALTQLHDWVSAEKAKNTQASAKVKAKAETV